MSTLSSEFAHPPHRAKAPPEKDPEGSTGARPDQALCAHCGTPFSPRGAKERYCCAGCEYVAHLIGESGLEQYYELRERSISPVGSMVFAERDFGWFHQRVARA